MAIAQCFLLGWLLFSSLALSMNQCSVILLGCLANMGQELTSFSESMINDINEIQVCFPLMVLHLWPLVSSPFGSKHTVTFTSTFAAKKSCSVRFVECVAVLCMFRFLNVPYSKAFPFFGKKLRNNFVGILVWFFHFCFFPLALF